jgi:hypothetical protein
MKITVYVRSDRPEQNKIGIYKKYMRTLREDGLGYYVKINKAKAYLRYTKGEKSAFVDYWIF